MGLQLAASGAQVIAVEKNRSACHEATCNAKSLGLQERFRCLAQDVERAMVRVGAVDVIIVDPPRKGLTAEVARALIEAKAATLVYVSCNPQTLVRDLQTLSSTYQIVAMTPVDLFPRTQHLEVVTHLQRRPA